MAIAIVNSSLNLSTEMTTIDSDDPGKKPPKKPRSVDEILDSPGIIIERAGNKTWFDRFKEAFKKPIRKGK